MTIIATGGHVTFRSLVPYARRPTEPFNVDSHYLKKLQSSAVAGRLRSI